MNIHELEKRVAAIPEKKRTPQQVELAMSLFMHKCDNFLELLAFLKATCDCTSADEAHDFLVNNAPDLIDRMEEVEGI